MLLLSPSISYMQILNIKLCIYGIFFARYNQFEYIRENILFTHIKYEQFNLFLVFFCLLKYTQVYLAQLIAIIVVAVVVSMMLPIPYASICVYNNSLSVRCICVHGLVIKFAINRLVGILFSLLNESTCRNTSFFLSSHAPFDAIHFHYFVFFQ